MSVRPRGTTRLLMGGFSWNFIFGNFSKICWENSSFIKIGQEWRAFSWRPDYIFIISRSFLLIMRNVSDKSFRENQNTHFVLCNSPPENRSACEKIWKNILDRGRSQMTIWRTRIACRMSKAIQIHALRLCNTHCFSTATAVARTRLNVILYEGWNFNSGNYLFTTDTK